MLESANLGDSVNLVLEALQAWRYRTVVGGLPAFGQRSRRDTTRPGNCCRRGWPGSRSLGWPGSGAATLTPSRKACPTVLAKDQMPRPANRGSHKDVHNHASLRNSRHIIIIFIKSSNAWTTNCGKYVVPTSTHRKYQNFTKWLWN